MKIGRTFATILAVATLALPRLAAASTSAQERALVAHIGITSETVVVAGLSITDAEALIARFTAAEELQAEFWGAMQDLSECVTAVAAVQEEIGGAGASEEQATALAGAEADSAEAQLELTGLEQQLFAAVVDGLGAEQVALLLVARSCPVAGIPAEFRVLNLTEREWRDISIALRAERRAVRRNEELAEVYAQRLSGIRSHPDVIAAVARLASGLDQMIAIFDQALESSEAEE